MNEVSLTKMRWRLFLLGVLKIPMIHYVRPKLIFCNDEEMQIKIPFRRRTKNHLNSMYFGALNIGADLAAGLFVYYLGERMSRTVTLAFKSSKADFLKIPESHVFFHCAKGNFIREKIYEASQNGERVNFSLPVTAKNVAGEVVAEFDMEVSIRVK